MLVIKFIQIGSKQRMYCEALLEYICISKQLLVLYHVAIALLSVTVASICFCYLQQQTVTECFVFLLLDREIAAPIYIVMVSV